jgi:hypothetical protein
MGDATLDGARKLQWTVKGIDPAVRELSRKAARKSGMRVSSWVEMKLRTAAETELTDRGRPEPLQGEILEKLEENSKVMQEMQRDLNLLQRGFIETIIHNKG